MNNGGKISQRGFIFQSIIAMIECLERDDWDEIKMEPETDQDKVDIILYRDSEILSAMQVKSSTNPFERSDVSRWLSALRNDAKEAERITLYLVGDSFTPGCQEYIKDNPEVNTISFKNLQSICKERLINYIKKKTNISNIDNNNIKFCNNQLKHPYFYTNHNEEIRVKFILYLIEGLFFEEHLTQDYTLLNLLDRDGYASLTQLEKHPQLVYSKISINNLRTVFLEHRQNEVTETVETFDDILIRNKDWRNIKKKGKLLPSDKIKQNLLNEMGIIKHNKMKKLMGKKSELTQIQDKLYFRYHVLTQNVKQIQSHFSTINNFYNCQTSNFIFNNNNYNIYNNYNGNQRKTDY